MIPQKACLYMKFFCCKLKWTFKKSLNRSKLVVDVALYGKISQLEFRMHFYLENFPFLATKMHLFAFIGVGHLS
jgi:hypothetical protein